MGLFATVRHSLRILWRAARELFHEVTGAVFFILALAALQGAWRSWHRGAGRWHPAENGLYAGRPRRPKHRGHDRRPRRISLYAGNLSNDVPRASVDHA